MYYIYGEKAERLNFYTKFATLTSVIPSKQMQIFYWIFLHNTGVGSGRFNVYYLDSSQLRKFWKTSYNIIEGLLVLFY